MCSVLPYNSSLYNLRPLVILLSPSLLRSFVLFLVLNSPFTFFLCGFLRAKCLVDPLIKLTDRHEFKTGILRELKKGLTNQTRQESCVRALPWPPPTAAHESWPVLPWWKPTRLLAGLWTEELASQTQTVASSRPSQHWPPVPQET